MDNKTDKIEVSKKDLQSLIGYIDTLYNFVDTESMEYENAELVADGYADFVVPVVEALKK